MVSRLITLVSDIRNRQTSGSSASMLSRSLSTIFVEMTVLWKLEMPIEGSVVEDGQANDSPNEFEVTEVLWVHT